MLIVVIIGVIILWGFLFAWGQEMRFKASAAPPDLSFWLLSCPLSVLHSGTCPLRRWASGSVVEAAFCTEPLQVSPPPALLDKAGFRSQGGRKVLHAVATAAVLGSHSRGPVLGLKTHLDVAHLFGPRLLSANAVAKQGPESALLC